MQRAGPRRQRIGVGGVRSGLRLFETYKPLISGFGLLNISNARVFAPLASPKDWRRRFDYPRQLGPKVRLLDVSEHNRSTLLGKALNFAKAKRTNVPSARFTARNSTFRSANRMLCTYQHEDAGTHLKPEINGL